MKISLLNYRIVIQKKRPLSKPELPQIKVPPVFHHYKCAFVHVPKAGGSSIVHGLFGFQIGHYTIVRIREALQENFNEYFKFAFVRNPYDRCKSAFYYMKKGGMNDPDKKWSDEFLANYKDFGMFVKNGLHKEEILSWDHFRPQVDFLLITPRTIGVDFVGRVENFNEDIKFVCEKLGVERSFKIRNKNVGESQHEWSTYEKDKIKEIYKDDFELFGYAY